MKRFTHNRPSPARPYTATLHRSCPATPTPCPDSPPGDIARCGGRRRALPRRTVAVLRRACLLAALVEKLLDCEALGHLDRVAVALHAVASARVVVRVRHLQLLRACRPRACAEMGHTTTVSARAGHAAVATRGIIGEASAPARGCAGCTSAARAPRP
eukprot:341656-Prymnesium_polylepis.1